jgi:ribosomal protein S18 acetylase RimI-like enzyme
LGLAAQLIVRPARLSDALDIAVLHHVAVHRLGAGFYDTEILGRWAPPVTLDRAERLYREAQANGEVTLVAERGDDIAGFGVVELASGRISGCYVAPDLARKGIGKALVSAMEAAIAAQRAPTIHVRASRNARSFYTALGYRVTGRGEHLFEDRTRMVVVHLEKDIAPLG